MRQNLYTVACFCTLVLCGLSLNLFAQKTTAETGKCGFYADSYHGRLTESGEKYNKDALTCSHKTLAFGTKIRVTRLDNKKSVVVRVNDRGPFIEGYIVDVSGAAAKEIGLSSGSAQVKIELVESAQSALANDAQTETEVPGAPANKTTSTTVTTKSVAASTTPATYSTQTTPKTNVAPATTKVVPTSNLYKVDIAQSEKKGFGIQIVSLNDANGVLPFVGELQTTYPGKVLVNVVRDELNQPTYKAIVGPFPDKKSAETAQKSLPGKYKKTMIVDLSGM